MTARRTMPRPNVERPNTLSGLVAKRDELAKFRDRLEADIRAITVDIDHLEAAIRIFDPEDTPEARRRYAAMHRAPKGQSMRFVLGRLREAQEPLTSRRLAEAWCQDRGLAMTVPSNAQTTWQRERNRNPGGRIIRH